MNDENKCQFSAEVVLYEPEIPQNTGNIARTCAALGCRLHLIEPLGFSLEDKYLKRAGLDYWNLLDVFTYPNLDAFFQSNFQTDEDARLFLLTKKSRRSLYEADFHGRMFFLFGKETYGLPESLMSQYPDDCFRLPMRTQARSLNLSNTVAVVLYEAFRQNGCPGLV
jgi:tRNA (cytidine/uridine-2'-O-)-methyltransferase